MSTERLKARMRLEQRETVHLAAPNNLDAFCGRKHVWDRLTTEDAFEEVTCAACRSLALSRGKRAK